MRWNSAQTCSSSSTIRTRSGGPFIIVYLGGREMKLEGRAAPRSGVDGDAPAVSAHDALADREPEPHAFFLLGRKERAEDVGQRRFGNADPGVGDGDHHGIRAVARGADRHLAAAGHRLGGVEQEIDQHLLELVGVRLDRRQPAGDIGFYPDLVVEQIVPSELYGVGDDRLDLARLGLGGERPREVHEITDQLAAPHRLAFDDPEPLLVRSGAFFLVEQLLGEAQDDLERVVELVRDRGGELADGDEAVRGDELPFLLFAQRAELGFALAQPLLGLAALGDLRAERLVRSLPLPRAQRAFLFQLVAPPRQLGRLLSRLFIEARVLDGDRRLLADLGEELQLLAAEFAALLGIEADDAEHLAFQRHRYGYAGDEAVLPVKITPYGFLIVNQIVDDERRPPLDRRRGTVSRLVHGVGFPFGGVDVAAEKRLELAGLGVEEPQRDDNGAGKKFLQLGEEDRDDPVEFQRGGDRLVDRADNGEPLDVALDLLLGLFALANVADDPAEPDRTPAARPLLPDDRDRYGRGEGRALAPLQLHLEFPKRRLIEPREQQSAFRAFLGANENNDRLADEKIGAHAEQGAGFVVGLLDGADRVGHEIGVGRKLEKLLEVPPLGVDEQSRRGELVVLRLKRFACDAELFERRGQLLERLAQHEPLLGLSPRAQEKILEAPVRSLDFAREQILRNRRRHGFSNSRQEKYLLSLLDLVYRLAELAAQ